MPSISKICETLFQKLKEVVRFVNLWHPASQMILIITNKLLQGYIYVKKIFLFFSVESTMKLLHVNVCMYAFQMQV